MEIYPLQFEDFDVLEVGNHLEISGVLYGSPDVEGVLIILPGEEGFEKITVMHPDLEEWQSIIRQSDLKEVQVTGDDDKSKKIILRKSTRQIETKIMWEVFRRDNYTCRYCGEDKQPMTVDHMVLWEKGGPSIPMNLITSCRKCNKTRGNMEYEDWLRSPYYLAKVPSLEVDILALNSKVAMWIPEIERDHMRTVKRSR